MALKKLKMEREKEGFPITSLREINTLLKAQHPNIVTVRVSALLRWLNTVFRAVSSNSRDSTHFKIDKQTWWRKSNGTQKMISQNLLIKIL